LPLLEKARIEVYLPDLDKPAYVGLVEQLATEFTYSFGGSTVVRGLEGNYLSHLGSVMVDSITLVYTDAPFQFDANFRTLSEYADYLRKAAYGVLDEEAVLVVVYPVYHSR
jgi:hypothetical protein